MPASNDRTFLLVGATGQIGHALRGPLSRLGTVVAPSRDTLDLTVPDTIRRAVHDAVPDVIVNAAAYTDVDRAEEEPERAAVLNARGPGVLADAAADVGARLVHYSTDYVFDGTSDTPYTEADRPSPINVYGRTKYEGEVAIREHDARSLILRTSWVYSDRRSNFLRAMLRLADKGERLTVVDDQIGAPTSAAWVADATTRILRRLAKRDAGDTDELYHLAASGQTSWYGFAKAIFAQFECPDAVVEPVASDEYPTAAERPAYTVLDSGKARSRFDLAIPTWSEQLAAVRRRMDDERG